MKWWSWIYQWRRARRLTPGQAPLLWRKACSAEPAHWVWCRTWAQCCSACPAIPPGPQRERTQKITHPVSLHGTSFKLQREDVKKWDRGWESEKRKSDELSCAIITWKVSMWLVFLHVGSGVLRKSKVSAVDWKYVDSHGMWCCWQKYEETWMSLAGPRTMSRAIAMIENHVIIFCYFMIFQFIFHWYYHNLLV